MKYFYIQTKNNYEKIQYVSISKLIITITMTQAKPYFQKQRLCLIFLSFFFFVIKKSFYILNLSSPLIRQKCIIHIAMRCTCTTIISLKLGPFHYTAFCTVARRTKYNLYSYPIHCLNISDIELSSIFRFGLIRKYALK